MRLVTQRKNAWGQEAEFHRAAAGAMRRILINYARDRARLKRGGGRRRVELAEQSVPNGPAETVLAVHEALNGLQSLDELKGRVVELRYFGGLTIEQTAAALNLPLTRVKREWHLAKIWLLRNLAE